MAGNPLSILFPDKQDVIPFTVYSYIACQAQGFHQRYLFAGHIDHTGICDLTQHRYFKIKLADLNDRVKQFLLFEDYAGDFIGQLFFGKSRCHHRTDFWHLDVAIVIHQVTFGGVIGTVVLNIFFRTQA